MGRPADPWLDRRLARLARDAGRSARPGRAGGHQRPVRGRGLVHGDALQAGPSRGFDPAGARRNPARHRQFPHRSLRARGHRRRAWLAPALDRDRSGDRRNSAAGGRGGRTGDRAGRAQPRRVPLGLDRRRRVDHPGGARGRRPGPLGPQPFGRIRAAAAGRLGCRPCRRLFLQVPERRSGGARLRLPADRASRHAAAASRSGAGWAGGTPSRWLTGTNRRPACVRC
jgi:hypothetical protein